MIYTKRGLFAVPALAGLMTAVAFAEPPGEVPPGFPEPSPIVATNGPQGVVLVHDPAAENAGFTERCVFARPVPVTFSADMPRSGTNTLQAIFGKRESGFVHSFLGPLMEQPDASAFEYARTAETTTVRFPVNPAYAVQNPTPDGAFVEFEVDNATGFFRPATNCLAKTAAQLAEMAASETCAYWNRYWEDMGSGNRLSPGLLRPKSVTRFGTVVEVGFVETEDPALECRTWLDAKTGYFIGSAYLFD